MFWLVVNLYWGCNAYPCHAILWRGRSVRPRIRMGWSLSDAWNRVSACYQIVLTQVRSYSRSESGEPWQRAGRKRASSWGCVFAVSFLPLCRCKSFPASSSCCSARIRVWYELRFVLALSTGVLKQILGLDRVSKNLFCSASPL